ncbi:Uncharacterized protein FWK35_00006837 [Aphis craccivora]|uniref:Uncharacterized protein n=1 Tax=Aphis craccivora TaxID=307492 RepID=A0A6G0ZKX7_APHCR|nr:Uncharacterized protein FWK35_00006837 [Aphis craccivora]
MDNTVNESDNNCSTSEVNTDGGKYHEQINRLNILSVPIITIDSDDDDDETCHNNDTNIIIIDSDDDLEETEQVNRKMLNRKIGAFKYKMRRTLNLMLRYYAHYIPFDELLNIEDKLGSLKRVRKNVNRTLSAESTSRPPMSKDQCVSRVQTLRRRYFDAIQLAHCLLYIVSNYSYLVYPMSEDWPFMNDIILKRDFDLSVNRGPDGEIESHELDLFVQNIDFSDSESSNSEFETSTSYNKITPVCSNQLIKNEDSHIKARRKERLQQRQKLRNHFKKVYHQCYSGDVQSQASSKMRHCEKKNKLSNNKASVKNSTATSSPYLSPNKNVTVNKVNVEVIQLDTSDTEYSGSSSIDKRDLYHKNLQERLRKTACQTQLKNSNLSFLENKSTWDVPLSRLALKNKQETFEQDNNSNQNVPSTSMMGQVPKTKIHVGEARKVSELACAAITEQVTDIETGTVTDSRYNKIEVVEPLRTDIDCENQKVNSSHNRNVTLRETAQTIAKVTRALSSSHTKIFHSITRMADALYKTTIEPIVGPTEEARPGKEDKSVEIEIVEENSNIKFMQQHILNDIQQMLDSIWKLLKDPLPSARVESSITALSITVDARMQWAEEVANKIVSSRRITTYPPSNIPTSAAQISIIESQKSTRDTHRIHLSPSRLSDDNKLTSQQQKPSSPAVSQHKRLSPPTIVITPSPDDPESLITEELPPRRNRSHGEIETCGFSSCKNTKNLLAPPKINCQRRSRSRTRDPYRPRFCSLSPPNSRTHNVFLEQKRERSRLPLTGPRSHVNLSVTTTPHLPPTPQLPCSPPSTSTDITTSTAIAVVTTETITERSDLSAPPSPPEALRSTLLPTSNDDDGTASFSQTALALLELSGQSPISDQTVDTRVVDNQTPQTTATANTTTVTSAAAAAADYNELMSNSGVLATTAVGGGGLARSPATKRQRSRDKSNSPLNARKLKLSSSEDTEQQPDK